MTSDLEKPSTIWNKLRRPISRLVVFSGDEFSLAVAVFLLAKILIGEQLEIIALGNSFLHLLLLPTLIWLPVCVIRRRRDMAMVTALPVIFFAASYGRMFIPKAADAKSPDLKILTYNLHSEQHILDPMVAVIRDSGADVVAVQELSVEAADRFGSDLSGIYPYQAFHTAPGEPVIGQGVLSRYPITADDYWRNDFLPIRLAHQRVQFNVEGQTLTLYNTHPIHPINKVGRLFYVDLRTQEIESVLTRASQETTPILIVGDFNMADQSTDYQRITATYRDTYREVGWGLGFTFPDFSSANAVPVGSEPLPVPQLVRLDYIFHSPELQAIESHVWRTSGGSDHRPVFAAFNLTSK